MYGATFGEFCIEPSSQITTASSGHLRSYSVCLCFCLVRLLLGVLQQQIQQSQLKSSELSTHEVKKMKGDGVPCTNHCGQWVEHEDWVCPICKEDVFCSKDCFWQGVPKCSDYYSLKHDAEMWTPRSVVNQLFARIRRDSQLMNQLRMVREQPNHMVVFYIQDEEMLTILLNNNVNWKQTILQNCDSRPSMEQTDSVLSFVFAVYCTKNKSLDYRLL